MHRVAAAGNRIAGTQDQNATNDPVASGGALVLLWPAALMIKVDGATAQQLAALKGQRDAIEHQSIAKKCGIEFRRQKREETVPTRSIQANVRRAGLGGDSISITLSPALWCRFPDGGAMVSVIIPTLDAERELVDTLSALIPAVVDEVVREVIIVDGGSTDRTEVLANASGARYLTAEGGRGPQLAAGARVARHPWLLFLHADTVLEEGWYREVGTYMARADRSNVQVRAAVFRFGLDDTGWRPRLVEAGVALRCRLFAMPYGDQGLLISRRLYEEIGGYHDLPLFEDVDIIRRLGRRRLHILKARAVTSAARYRQSGYLRRVLRNWWCLVLYAWGVPIERIERVYDG